MAEAVLMHQLASPLPSFDTQAFAADVEDFPTGIVFSAATCEALLDCIAEFIDKPSDQRLVRAMEAQRGELVFRPGTGSYPVFGQSGWHRSNRPAISATARTG